MATTTSSPVQERKGRLDRDGIKRIVQVIVGITLFGLLLFVSAGRLDWWNAWLYLGLWGLSTGLASVVVLRRNPELINERGRKAENQKAWDKLLLRLYFPLPFLAMILAGLDAVRFGWSQIPLWLVLTGFVLGLVAMGLSYSVMVFNAFASAVVRIQEERGHEVVTDGPYRFVRHPMYAGLLLSWLGTPLLLGSWWTYVVAVPAILIFVIRTALEDRTLQEELPGYTDYAERVRYRLLPGVW